MQPLIQNIQAFIQTHKLFTKKFHVLVAVSGGIDSIVLLHALQNLQIPCTVAHCNFQLRNEESTRDEMFVIELAKKLQIDYCIQKFDTTAYAEKYKISIQEAARKLRYEWFEKQRIEIEKQQQLHCYIATAHHANDVAETALFNFSRGTGIAGLHGIPAMQNNIIRPLLHTYKSQIEAYATEHQLQWITDSSNSSNKYTRNKIRNEIFPLLQQHLPQVVENINSTVQHIKAAEKVYEHTIHKILQKLLVKKENEWKIAIAGLQQHIFFDALLFEILLKFGFNSKQLYEIKKLMQSNNGSFIANPTYKVINNRGWLIFTAIESAKSSFIQVFNFNDKVAFEQGTITFTQQENNNAFEHNKQANIAYINAALLEWPLIIRKPKQGDYFYPFGLQKKKKLSRFYIDQKLSITDKEKVWIIESNKKILWIIGLRIDNRFRIEPTTKQIMKIVWNEK